jgi:hypothetical protein
LSHQIVFVAAHAEVDQAALGSGVCLPVPAAVLLLLQGSGLSVTLCVDAGTCATQRTYM